MYILCFCKYKKLIGVDFTEWSFSIVAVVYFYCFIYAKIQIQIYNV